jgi:hypothetical protein
MGFASFLRNLTTSEFSRWLVFSIISVSVWEFGSRLYNAPFLLPAPSRILEEFLKNPALVLANAFITTQEIVVGFVLGSLIALVAAIVLMALPKFIEDFIFRLVTTLNSIPFVALASLVVVWIGVQSGNRGFVRVFRAGLSRPQGNAFDGHDERRTLKLLQRELFAADSLLKTPVFVANHFCQFERQRNGSRQRRNRWRVCRQWTQRLLQCTISRVGFMARRKNGWRGRWDARVELSRHFVNSK